MELLIHQSIELYNNKVHKALNGLTPNQMEEALFEQHQNKHPTDLVLLSQNNNSEIANSLREYKLAVATKYKASWEQFFVESGIKQQQNFHDIS